MGITLALHKLLVKKPIKDILYFLKSQIYLDPRERGSIKHYVIVTLLLEKLSAASGRKVKKRENPFL